MKHVHIGVIGSMTDTKIKGSLLNIAKELGKEIAQSKATLLFSFESDFESLSLVAAQEAQKTGGKTIAFIWGDKKQDLPQLQSLQIVTGQNRGGGREFSFILSCDVVIAISGGSGTLMEIAMAYQANIPVVVIKNSGGWSQELAGRFLDDRKRQKIISAKNAHEAIAQTFKLRANL